MISFGKLRRARRAALEASPGRAGPHWNLPGSAVAHIVGADSEGHGSFKSNDLTPSTAMPRDRRIANPFSPLGRGQSSSNLKIAPVPEVIQVIIIILCFVFRQCSPRVAMNARDTEPPCTPPRPTGNGGAGYFESDGEMDSENDSDEDLQASKKKRKHRGRREFTLMKRWVTGENAKMDSEDIERGLYELARHGDWMSQSKLKKLPGHQSKSTNVSLWKQFREYKVQKGSILIRLFRIFRCPLHHRCKCKAGIAPARGPVVTMGGGPDQVREFLQLEAQGSVVKPPAQPSWKV
jgi:hypothetical protein